MDEINAETEDLRLIADGIIAAGLKWGGKPGKNLNESYENLRVAAGRAFPVDGTGDLEPLRRIVTNGLDPTVKTDYERWQPLHWPLVLPDITDRGGFDAIIGNPPFLGNHKISGAMGTNIAEWLRNVVMRRPGKVDLCAYFMNRTLGLLAKHGTSSGLASNSIASGDNLHSFMKPSTANGIQIYRAIRSTRWGTSSASVFVSVIWFSRLPIKPPFILDGESLERSIALTSSPQAAPRTETP